MKTWLKSVVTLFAVTTIGTAIAEPPANSGVVVRGTYNNAYFDVDMKKGISVVLGADISEFCNGIEDFDVIAYSDKAVQQGLRIVTVEKSEVIASVWSFTEFDCGLFTTELPLATGMASMILNDNDLIGNENCEEKNNINVFSRKAHGTLYAPSGEARQFAMNFWGQFDCDADTFESRTKINLTK